MRQRARLKVVSQPERMVLTTVKGGAKARAIVAKAGGRMERSVRQRHDPPRARSSGPDPTIARRGHIPNSYFAGSLQSPEICTYLPVVTTLKPGESWGSPGEAPGKPGVDGRWLKSSA